MNNLEIKLEKLFKEWKKEHIEDNNYKNNAPNYQEIFVPKSNFIKDGFCVFKEKENTILYISKESHEYDTKKEEINKKLEPKDNETKWLKENFIENKNYIFPRRIKEMQKILNEDVTNISFMNINKRRRIWKDKCENTEKLCNWLS